MNRKSIPEKIKKILQREILSRCPFCSNEEVAHFEFHHIDENPENNDLLNLIMLCPICHSKITKGDIARQDVEEIKKRLQVSTKEKQESKNNIIPFKAKFQNTVIGNNNRVTYNIRKGKTEIKYPEGCIGADIRKANYVSFLINIYHDFKKREVGKEKMNYAIFQAQLKNKFAIGQSRSLNHVPIERFEELVHCIQSRIDGTIHAKAIRGKGVVKNYPSFSQYLVETDGPE